MSLPPPGNNQAYCNVSALEAGHIEFPLEMFMTGATPGAVSIAPSLSFLITHSQIPDKFVFDLGIRRDWEHYPPGTVHWIRDGHSVHVAQDVADSLEMGGLSPSDITTVCLSHCHHDHVGDPRPFTNSTFLVGAGSAALFNPGYPTDPKSRFPSDLLPPGRTTFLSPENWTPLGPFPHAFDFYGDGSLYIVDAPGHLPGHINVLVRSSADGGWIYLGGDSAHHWNLLTGEAEVSVGHPGWHKGPGQGCAHVDKASAEDHILRIRALWKTPRVKVILAHDEPWYKENKGGLAFWPGKIPSL